MTLFDPQDLKDYLGPSVVVNDDQAVIVDQIVSGLIEAELGYDPTPSDSPFTITLSVEQDNTVRLPRLVETVTAVQANGVAVRYVQHGNTITVATATLPTSAWLLWVNDRTIDVTYTYTQAPPPLMAAALLTAATLLQSTAASLAGGSTVGVRSEQIDDYQVTYADAAALFGSSGLPPQALALLRPYRRVGRSVKLRA
jgi:hypothetical protein